MEKVELSTSQALSLGAAMRFGWNKLASQHFFMIWLTVIIGLVYLFTNFVQKVVEKSGNGWLTVLASIFVYIIATVTNLVLIKSALAIHDELPISFKNILDFTGRQFGYYLLAAIMFAILPMIIGAIMALALFSSAVFINLGIWSIIILFSLGLIFLCLGAWYYLTFQFFSYFVIDRNATAWAAFKGSRKITRGYKMSLALILFVLALINMLGAVLVLVGLVVTVPLSSLVLAYTYRFIGRHNNVVEAPISSPLV